MRCEAAERDISNRMDGDGDRHLTQALDAHLAGCSRCRAFGVGVARLRQAARIEATATVPDLLPPIMAQVRRLPRRGFRLPALALWGRPAAAFVAGAVASSLLIGGMPGLRRPGIPALASEIPRRIAEASTEVTAFRATLEITERNFHPLVPERRFVARVAFGAPERLVVELEDRTTYPSGAWPRNDVLVAGDGERRVVRSPSACPREALPACSPGPEAVSVVTGREPFDGETPLPTDLVLPVQTLAGYERVQTAGRTRLLGRSAITVSLAYRDAAPLFGYLRAGGSWRPIFQLDRVLVSLDEETMFPLAYEVRAAGGLERQLWTARNAPLPPEPEGGTILQAAVTSFDTSEGPGRPQVPKVPGLARDGGFRAVGVDALAAVTGRPPLVPKDLRGLPPYRMGTSSAANRSTDEVVLSFARGLAWLKVRETRSWPGPAPYGNLGAIAQRVRLPGGGVAYYEPASSSAGRRLWVHGEGWDVFLETNLPVDDLLQVAGSLPLRGEPAPDAWRTRSWPGGSVTHGLSLAEAAEEGPFLLVPEPLPPGYRLADTALVRSDAGVGLTLYYRRSGIEPDGVGIRLHQSSAGALPPPLDPEVFTVTLRGHTGRYSSARNELEWVEAGAYRSVTGAGLDLAGLLSLAESLRAPEEGR